VSKVTCPACGSEHIREYGTTMYDHEVAAWEKGEDGLLYPLEYGNRRDWVESDAREGFECAECNWQGEVDQLKVED
jgi:hypothetical protein